MPVETLPWSVLVPLAEARRGARRVQVRPDETVRNAIAKMLALVALPSLDAEVELGPWLDGAVIGARWRATVVQTCGVTLDPFETALDGRFELRCVPSDSPHAPATPEGELELEPDADDPPDVLEGDRIDVGAYVVEHLALEIDPFPRKPNVEFVPPPPETPASPFASLAALKQEPGGSPER